jgi:hypothetical protein
MPDLQLPLQLPRHPSVLHDLFGDFGLEMCLRLAFAVRTARTAGDETDFGRTLRFDALRDTCHLFEAWLRAHGYGGKGVRSCLGSAYGGCGEVWWSGTCANWGSLTSAEKTCEAESCVQKILVAFPTAVQDDLLGRSHLLTGLMRNRTAHQFDPDASFLCGPLYEQAYLAPWVCFYHAKAVGK